MIRRAAVTAALVLSATLLGTARQQGHPDLDYFVGTWLAVATDPRSGEETRVRYTVRRGVGGKWYLGAADDLSSLDESQDVWGRDPASNEIVRAIFDSNGVYALVRSRGWSGATMVLEGDAWTPQGAVKVRETITRVSPGEFKAVWEVFREGRWTAYSVERVTRDTGRR